MDLAFLANLFYFILRIDKKKLLLSVIVFLLFIFHSAEPLYLLNKYAILAYLVIYCTCGFFYFSNKWLIWSFLAVFVLSFFQFFESNFINTTFLSTNYIHFKIFKILIGYPNFVGQSYAHIISTINLFRVSGSFSEPALYTSALFLLISIFYRERNILILAIFSLLFSFSGLTIVAGALAITYVLFLYRFRISSLYFLLCIMYFLLAAITLYMLPLKELADNYPSLFDRISSFFYWEQGSWTQKVFGFGALNVCYSDLAPNTLKLSDSYVFLYNGGFCLLGQYSLIGSVLQDYGLFGIGMIFWGLSKLKFNKEINLLLFMFIITNLTFSYYTLPVFSYIFLGFIFNRMITLKGVDFGR